MATSVFRSIPILSLPLLLLIVESQAHAQSPNPPADGAPNSTAGSQPPASAHAGDGAASSAAPLDGRSAPAPPSSGASATSGASASTAASDSAPPSAGASPSPQPVDKTVVTFSPIVDGQPGGPGQVGLEAIASYGQGDWEGQTTIQYTGRSGFFANALFALTFPTIQGGEGILDAETSVSFSWQQRWVGSNSSKTNFATLVSLQVPVDEPDQDVDVTITASLAQVVGRDVVYLNGYVETNSGPNPLPTGWGFFAGYKHPLSSEVAFIGSLGIESGDIGSAGLALQYNVNSHLTIGPGITLSTTLDSRTSLNALAGLLIYYGF